MSALNKFLEIFGPAISAVGREREHSVVTPVALTGKIGDRHQLQGRHPKFGQIVESLAGGREGSLWGEGSDMQFVDDGFLPRTSAPSEIFPFGIVPFKTIGIDDFAWSMHVLRLKTGRRVGNLLPIVDSEFVLRADASRLGDELKPTVFVTVKRNSHRSAAIRQADLDLMGSGSPQA